MSGHGTMRSTWEQGASWYCNTCRVFVRVGEIHVHANPQAIVRYGMPRG